MKKLMVLGVLFLVGCTEHKQATVTAKDGINGKDGQSIIGAQGLQGSKGDKGDKGDTGVQGQKGDSAESVSSTTGPSGANGKNAVIKQYSATIAQCANGGIVLDTFTDMNSNNTYEANVDVNYQRTVLCNQISTCEDKKESDDKKDDKLEDKKDN
jgi:hypothetical protein